MAEMFKKEGHIHNHVNLDCCALTFINVVTISHIFCFLFFSHILFFVIFAAVLPGSSGGIVLCKYTVKNFLA